jgi:hypothetical protein
MYSLHDDVSAMFGACCSAAVVDGLTGSWDNINLSEREHKP